MLLHLRFEGRDGVGHRFFFLLQLEQFPVRHDECVSLQEAKYCASSSQCASTWPLRQLRRGRRGRRGPRGIIAALDAKGVQRVQQTSGEGLV